MKKPNIIKNNDGKIILPKRLAVAVSAVFILSSTVFAEVAAPVPVSRIDNFLNQMKQAMDIKDELATDFWMARFIGEIIAKKNTERTLADLSSYLGRHRAGQASQQLSGNYSDSFVDWFIEQSQSQFGLDDVRVYGNSFELINGSIVTPTGNYFAAIFAVPYIEGWDIYDKPSPQLIVLASSVNKPNILSGEILPSSEFVTYYHTVPFEVSGPVQHVWKPEFEDLDDDKLPELFIRYNYTGDNGVHQELAVFRFEENEPAIIKRFTGHYGGIARRIGNKQIEVGDSMQYGEQMTFETWEYQGSDFVSMSTRSGEHILISENWRQYY